MTRKLISILFPIAAAATVILLVVYAVVQQSYRQAADDPQIELVENAKAALDGGVAPATLFANAGKVDMSKSLSIFGMVFDDKGALVGSTAVNGSAAPFVPPAGVFDSVRKDGQDRITWETQTGLRYATVIDRYSSPNGSGFVLAARSLREVEVRESNLSWFVLFGWAGMMIALIVAGVVSAILKPLEANN